MWTALPPDLFIKGNMSNSFESAESLRNVGPVYDNPASSCRAKLKRSRLWRYYCICGVTIRLITTLFAKSVGGWGEMKTGSVTLSELCAAPYCFPGLSWGIGNAGVTEPGRRIWYVLHNNRTIFYLTWHGGGLRLIVFWCRSLVRGSASVPDGRGGRRSASSA